MRDLTTAETAWQYFAAGRFTEASDFAHAILKRAPQDVAALSCAAVADWELGRDIEDAIALLKHAAKLQPDNSAIWHNLATIHASHGDLAASVAAFERALEINPGDSRAFFGLAQNHRFTEETALVRQMLDLYGSGTLDRVQLEFLCFGLAKVYADVGNASRAMHFCIEANWLADRPWDSAGERRRAETLIDLATSGRLHQARGNMPGPAPVFIVGMPRSGTTLVEAILSRHPQVHVLGESARIPELDRRLTGNDPANLPGLSRDHLRVSAEQVLKQMRADAGQGVSVLLDKTPANAFHLGLIAALFPQAKVIHMRRHPLDCGLSNLLTRFTRDQGFAFRQTDLGERIRQTSAVMAGWKQSGLLPILDVSYESVVAEPEAEARRMLGFLGLPWDAACLTPEQARRSIHTASQFQVRQKIYSSSVGRHAGYREWLSPLIAALGGDEWIEAEFRDQQTASAPSAA